MADISGNGTIIRVIASVTFPTGFTITEFADDADPFDMPSLQIADSAVGGNGDLITWTKANPLKPTINVIPDGEDDENLSILLEANRAGKGKKSAKDEITLTVFYPNGKKTTFEVGAITDGMPANSWASAGRFKTKPYVFSFQNRTDT